MPLCELYAKGLSRASDYTPPWISVPRYLVAKLTDSTFMNHIDTESLSDAAQRPLANAPVIEL